MATHKLAILVEAIGAAKAAKDLKGVDRSISSIGARGGKGLRTAANNIQTLAVGAAGLAAAGLVGAVKAAGDFEASLNTINTVAGLTDQALGKVGDDIRKVARDSGTSLSDLTAAYYDLVSAGIKPGADALAVLKQANTLAIGGLATTAETVDLLTSAINTYGLDAKGAAQATDQFAEAIALGKVTAAEIAGSFSIVGPLAQKMGIGIDEISAAYAQLTARGVPAAEAMTQMRSAIMGIMKPTSQLKAASKVLGVDFAKIAKNQGLAVAMRKIVAYSQKTGIPLAKLLGRVEAVNYALSVSGSAADDYDKALAQVRKATGVAADQMSERQKGLNYELKRLKALAIDAGITIGSKLLPKLTPLAEKAVAFLETHQADIDKFGDSIASAFDKAAAFAAKIPWDAIGSGLKTAADWSGRLMDAFASMPAGVQSTIIALAGLNKLSGGAISGIVGELGKGLIKGVLGMTAGVVNINAGVVNGGGGPGGGIGDVAGKVGGVAAGGAGIGLGAAASIGVGSLVVGFITAQAIKTASGQTETEWQKNVNNSYVRLGLIYKDIDDLNSKVNKPTGSLTGHGGPGRGGPAQKTATEGWAQGQFKDVGTKITDLKHDAVGAIGDSKAASAKAGVDVVQATGLGARNVANTTARGTSGITTQSIGNTSRIVGAIAANRPYVDTKVYVTISGSQVTQSQTTTTRTGGSSSSRSNDGYNDAGK